MIILHYDDGFTKHLDLSKDEDLRLLDDIHLQKKVRRVAIVDCDGKRIDLPLNQKGIYRLWMERVEKDNQLRGERFCMETSNLVMTATLYYSDKRVVVDLDHSGGFRCSRQETFR